MPLETLLRLNPVEEVLPLLSFVSVLLSLCSAESNQTHEGKHAKSVHSSLRFLVPGESLCCSLSRRSCPEPVWSWLCLLQKFVSWLPPSVQRFRSRFPTRWSLRG